MRDRVGNARETGSAVLKSTVFALLIGWMSALGCETLAQADSPLFKGRTTSAVQRHPASTTAHQRFAEMQRQKGREMIEVVLLGDSITDWWRFAGSAVYHETFDADRTFNMGVAGDRTEHVLWRLEKGNMDGIDPKLVVLLIGTNNLGRDRSKAVVAGIKAIVSWLHAERPQAQVLLLPLFPRGVTTADPVRSYVDAVNEILLLEAKEWGVEILDIAPALLDSNGRFPRTLSLDGIHLTELGYRRWAKAMAPTIDRLAERPTTAHEAAGR